MGPPDKRQLSAGSPVDRWAGHWISARWAEAPKEGGVRPAPGCHTASCRARSFDFGAACFARSPDPQRVYPAWCGVVWGRPWGSIPLLCAVFAWTSSWFVVPPWAWVCSLQAWALPPRSLGAGTSPPRPTSAPVFLEPASQVASLPPGSPPPALTLAFQNVLETTAPTLPPIHGDPQPQNLV